MKSEDSMYIRTLGRREVQGKQRFAGSGWTMSRKRKDELLVLCYIRPALCYVYDAGTSLPLQSNAC